MAGTASIVRASKFFGLVLILSLIVGFGLKTFAYQPSAEELRRQAIEKRIAALKKDCARFGDKWNECFHGDYTACKEIQTDSIPWFISQYGDTPEFACTAEPDPLQFGGVRR